MFCDGFCLISFQNEQTNKNNFFIFFLSELYLCISSTYTVNEYILFFYLNKYEYIANFFFTFFIAASDKAYAIYAW